MSPGEEKDLLPGLGDLVPVLGHLRGVRVRRTVVAYTAVAAAVKLGRHVTQQARQRVAYTVSIDSTDDLFVPVQAALYRELPNRARRSLAIGSSRRRGYEHLRRDERPLDVTSLFDAEHEHRFRHAGQTIRVKVEKQSDTVVVSDNYRERQRLVFTAVGVAGRDAVVDFVADVAAAQTTERAPRLYQASRWNEWLLRDNLTPRALESVALPDDQKARIVRDVGEFLNARTDYARLGIPYHRGYLFHGRPRTGKTSMARALASHFGLDVYYLPLASVEHDVGLFQLLAQVTPGAMLIVEDIDTVRAATTRDDDHQGVTLGGLLNATDGFATPDGVIVVMTTNRREILDGALVDFGRVDLAEEFNYLDATLAGQMIARFTPDTEWGVQWELPDGAEVEPAALSEALKRGFAGPAERTQAILELTPLRPGHPDRKPGDYGRTGFAHAPRFQPTDTV